MSKSELSRENRLIAFNPLDVTTEADVRYRIDRTMACILRGWYQQQKAAIEAAEPPVGDHENLPRELWSSNEGKSLKELYAEQRP